MAGQEAVVKPSVPISGMNSEILLTVRPSPLQERGNDEVWNCQSERTVIYVELSGKLSSHQQRLNSLLSNNASNSVSSKVLAFIPEIAC
jgi:hypothetical protein